MVNQIRYLFLLLLITLTIKGVSQEHMPSKIKKTILVKEDSIVFDTSSILINGFEIKYKDGSHILKENYKLNALKATLYFYNLPKDSIEIKY